MNIRLKEKFKSLSPFYCEDLESFTIITGKNGSGKSQLLSLFSLIKNTAKDYFILSPEQQNIQIEGIVRDNISGIGTDYYNNIIDQLWESFQMIPKGNYSYYKYLDKEGLLEKALQLKKPQTDLLSQKSEYFEYIKPLYKNHFGHDNIKDLNPIDEFTFIQEQFTQEYVKIYKIVDYLIAFNNKCYSEINKNDFDNTPFTEEFIDEQLLFNSKIEVIFFNYVKRREENKYSYFNKKENQEQNSAISDSKFIAKFIPPWDLINSILLQHNIDFKFREILNFRLTSSSPLKCELEKISSGEIIEFKDLSSGEKVIIGLIIKLFTSEYYKNDLKFPDLIILDEPDAHLHPQMSKLLLDVLDKTFVEELGIKVIMTTHSPSTIALANEASIYKLENGSTTKLYKITKDEALELLTSFIPTLTIDYKNHRQVFVESPTDLYYYQSIFNKINQEECLPYKLYFISNGYGAGNCKQVIKVVQDIRNAGNSSFWGIIDWDKKNSTTGVIKVHGESKRYSIENYLLDPVYMIVQLLLLKDQGLQSHLGVDNTYLEYDIINDDALLRKAIEYFFEQFYLKYPVYKSPNYKDKCKVNFKNELKLEYPKWYLEDNGHDLETKLKEIFLCLGKFKNEGELQQSLTDICCKVYPCIPIDTYNVIKDLMN